jgi:hypothetical protein
VRKSSGTAEIYATATDVERNVSPLEPAGMFSCLRWAAARGLSLCHGESVRSRLTAAGAGAGWG